ncbi:hypothetical protein CPB83DRAFT_191417 [Crepidotus variabilis]|uniref:Uncharacterized protein n=1 Tax=Crepidotus variabilis TaxID=179855 RepID=A0A9P6JR10_9AGAR|nr:hypothetical protein CPB83DRAFT_191417 [Crepidotus variabilis]
MVTLTLAPCYIITRTSRYPLPAHHFVCTLQTSPQPFCTFPVLPTPLACIFITPPHRLTPRSGFVHHLPVPSPIALHSSPCHSALSDCRCCY